LTSDIQEGWANAGADEEAAEAEEEADEAREETEELTAEADDEVVDAREAELETTLEAELVEVDRDTELETEDDKELAGRETELKTLSETERDVELEIELVADVEVDAGAEEDGVTMTPLTFLGIAICPVPEDRYKATLFQRPQFWAVFPGQGLAQLSDGICFDAEESEFPHQHSDLSACSSFSFRWADIRFPFDRPVKVNPLAEQTARQLSTLCPSNHCPKP